jgi:hypothetical protein
LISNLERYKSDFAALSQRGAHLLAAMYMEFDPEQYKKAFKTNHGEKSESANQAMPNFQFSYQAWYSETKALVRQLLPDRLEDFTRYYEKPKTRKELDHESYRIEDCLTGLTATRGADGAKIVGPNAAIPLFQQQLAILASVKVRFESSLI